MRRVGPFNELDLSFLHNPTQLLYMAKIQKTNDHISKDDLRSRFAAIDDEGLVDLLVDLL